MIDVFHFPDISSKYVSNKEAPLCAPLLVPKLKLIAIGIASICALSITYFIALIISVVLAKDS